MRGNFARIFWFIFLTILSNSNLLETFLVDVSMYFQSYAKISNFFNYFTTSYGCSWTCMTFSVAKLPHILTLKWIFWESPSVKVKSPTIFKSMPMDRPYPHYSNTTTFKKFQRSRKIPSQIYQETGEVAPFDIFKNWFLRVLPLSTVKVDNMKPIPIDRPYP